MINAIQTCSIPLPFFATLFVFFLLITANPGAEETTRHKDAVKK